MHFKQLLIALVAAVQLSGCVLTDSASYNYEVGGSYLETDRVESTESGAADSGENAALSDVSQGTEPGGLFEAVPSLSLGSSGFNTGASLSSQFSSEANIRLAADEMPMNDFLHYVFGELLQVDYILGDNLQSIRTPVTLNVQSAISPRRLFELTQELLLEREVTIQARDGLYVIMNLQQGGQANTVLGYGASPDSVPEGAQNVAQVVPLKFVFGLENLRVLRELTSVKVSPDLRRGVLILSGSRTQVVRALELLKILDAPANTSKHIGLVKLSYISLDEFIETVNELLKSEGIVPEAGADRRISLVPIYQLGALAVFASESSFVGRVRYWAEQMDKPSQGAELRYFIYQPRYARATDIGESLSKLIGGRSSSVQRSTERDSARVEENAQNSNAVSNETMSLVVDERANTLIFKASANEYQGLLPLIAQLDVMPKQVMLEMTIAEVTMTDQFRFGVEWAFSKGDFSVGTEPGLEAIGGGFIKWMNGDDFINMQAFESNNNVNIMSKPSLLVRDGVEANINVGTDIPVVGQTTTDSNNGVTRSVEYRKTGVKVSVTPTINSQGIVSMTISQENSNALDGGTEVEGNPSIFDRSITTEVVAESGQTVILGGLISEDISDNGSGIPILGGLPVIGGLFGSKIESVRKTELVIMVTPRIVDSSSQWDELKQSLAQGLEHVRL
ncbi:secretin N-terminal domain-containing protein [Aliagarivorans taiwanensis]|uniref:secretin N-terminal domain-containing protein n=1 Tax=Aliagarivorans taiwanensis TaxID=561966 RepID=UPI00146F9D19|nr:secretin N-terminal domain-containing protein [Aliagarivorans taiwanensis]